MAVTSWRGARSPVTSSLQATLFRLPVLVEVWVLGRCVYTSCFCVLGRRGRGSGKWGGSDPMWQGGSMPLLSKLPERLLKACLPLGRPCRPSPCPVHDVPGLAHSFGLLCSHLPGEGEGHRPPGCCPSCFPAVSVSALASLPPPPTPPTDSQLQRGLRRPPPYRPQWPPVTVFSQCHWVQRIIGNPCHLLGKNSMGAARRPHRAPPELSPMCRGNRGAYLSLPWAALRGRHFRPGLYGRAGPQGQRACLGKHLEGLH